jgi:alkylhydroperoxidase family enzyme
MLPNKLRLWLFDRLSVKTMRYVTAVPKKETTGLTQRVYQQIEEDFFVNGSLTSRSRVPNLLAAMWTGGRETILVDDHLDRTTKEAICALLSDINDCPYCGDMLVSLVHAGDEHDAASALFAGGVAEIDDPVMRHRLAWVEAVATPGRTDIPPCPFTPDELPEVLGSLMAMADINRFSHVVMDGSPVNAPRSVQGTALRIFGNELRATKVRKAGPGRALELLPPATLPHDLAWAAPNPRIADAVARWTATVEREASAVVSRAVRDCVAAGLRNWRNERMPLSRSWVDAEVSGLQGRDRAIARLALVLAKAPYQVSEDLVEELVNGDETRFIRILAWASFTAARRFAGVVAAAVGRPAAAVAA